jgi:hypothetical protein
LTSQAYSCYQQKLMSLISFEPNKFDKKPLITTRGKGDMHHGMFKLESKDGIWIDENHLQMHSKEKATDSDSNGKCSIAYGDQFMRTAVCRVRSQSGSEESSDNWDEFLWTKPSIDPWNDLWSIANCWREKFLLGLYCHWKLQDVTNIPDCNPKSCREQLLLPLIHHLQCAGFSPVCETITSSQ